MIISFIFKNNHFNSFSRNFHTRFSCYYLDDNFKKGISKLYFEFKTSQPCTFHTDVKQKKPAFVYPKKMQSFFENSTNKNNFGGENSAKQKKEQSKAQNFFFFRAQKPSICFHDIITGDRLSRKKVKTNMEIPVLKKITCSYTGKELVSNPFELAIPLCALTFLSGQNCTIVWAGKSVSGWKLRKNSIIGCKVTLRRKAARVFFDKFYVYGKEGLLKKEQNFLNNFPFYFGVSKNKSFIELQKSDRLTSNFSGFSISIN